MANRSPHGVPDRAATRRTQAQRREAAESALLAAAAETIVEAGVAGLTFARVGARAGYSRGIVTHHFGSKRGLLEAVARWAQTGFGTAVEDVPRGLDRLLLHVDRYLAGLGEDDPAWYAYMVLWVGAATDPELAPIMRERDEYFRADLRSDVSAGITTGAVRPDVDPDATAVALVGQLRGIGLQRLVDPRAVDLDRLRGEVVPQWRRALSR